MTFPSILFWIGISGAVLSAAGLWLDRQFEARRRAKAYMDESF